jgi:hypothetical protein
VDSPERVDGPEHVDSLESSLYPRASHVV